MKPLVYAFVCILMLASCATQPDQQFGYHKVVTKNHPFEKRLFAVGRNVPLLTESEWAEIRAQFTKREDYVFDSGNRYGLDLVCVDLIRKGEAPPGTHLTMFFERHSDHWIENKSREEEVVVLLQ